MKKFNLILLVLVFATSTFFLSCTNDGSDGGNVLAQYTGGDTNLAWGYTSTKQESAQSFKISDDSTCTKVELEITLQMGSPTGTYTVRIETDNAGLPSGTLVDPNAIKSQDASEIAIATWETWQFPSPFSLSANTTYWIILANTESAGTNAFTLGFNMTGDYTDGKRVSGPDGSWSDLTPDADINFKVHCP
jgi:hypothetical protein